MVELTRKAFEGIAETIKKSIREIEEGTRSYVAVTKEEVNRIFCNNFADWLYTTNPRFDKGRFMDACLIERE